MTDLLSKVDAPVVALILIGGALALILGVVGGASASTRADPALSGSNGLFHGTTNATSYNWAGYDIKTKSGAVTDVKASWNVPQIAATCPSTARYSSFWVGIDGDGSNTVEQIGTDTDCSGGSPVYYAWYEFYPAGSVTIGYAIAPADHMHGEVSYSTSTLKFTLTLKDLTKGKSFTVSKSVTAKRASAEWIAEAPSSGTSILKLTDFGWVVFSNDSATISGHTHSISGFPNYKITMWNLSLTKVMASPSGLNSSGTSFRVSWKSSGP